LRSNERSKVICSSKTSDRVLVSDPEALTARSGACNHSLACLLTYSPALQPNLTFSSNPPPPRVTCTACAQYLRATVAPERRDLASDIIPTTPPHTLLHNPTLSTSQPLARHPTVLPDIGRPNPVDHLDRAASRFRRRPRG
jgi:hypothetical protein